MSPPTALAEASVDLSQDTSHSPLKPWPISDLNTARDFKPLAPFSDDKGGRCLHIRIGESTKRLVQKEMKIVPQTTQSHLVPKLLYP